jgi:hypothetical protein
MRRRIIPMLVLLVFLLSGTANALSASDTMTVIKPQFVTTSYCEPELSFSGTMAQCSVSIKAYHSTDSITATMTLYRISGNSKVIVTYWNVSGTGSLSQGRTYNVTSGYTYQLTVNACVTGTSGSDYPVSYVQATCY